MLYCWQALLLAVVVNALSQGVKVGIDQAFKGKENRQKNGWVSNFLLPGVPLVLGAVMGAVIPIQPDRLVEFA